MPPILMATCYQLSRDPKQLELMRPYPPLATLTAAAVLTRAGHEVHLYDSMFEDGEASFVGALERVRPAVVVLYEDSFNWLTKMCLSNMRQVGLALVAASRARGAQVLVCGPDSTDHPEPWLEAGARAVIVGEGEATLEVCVPRLLKGEPLDEEAGLVVRQGSGLHRTPPRPLLEDLDALPPPRWDLIDVERYREAWRRRHGYFSINQITTRGCPFRCNWCAKPTWGDAYHTRSPARVVEEIRWQVKHLRPDHLWFADDILGLKKNWLIEFSERMAEAGLKLPFMCQTRVDLMTPSNVAALARAGCQKVWMGAESGSEKILAAMDKGITPEQIRQAVGHLKAAGIEVGLFLQLGYTGEGWEEIGLTRRLVAECLPDELGISVSYPLPGTRFYDRVVENLGEKTHWAHSDDLDPLFQGAWPRSFYPHLHRMIHHEHRSRLGLTGLLALARGELAPSRRALKRSLGLIKHLPGFVLERGWIEVARRRPGAHQTRRAESAA